MIIPESPSSLYNQSMSASDTGAGALHSLSHSARELSRGGLTSSINGFNISFCKNHAHNLPSYVKYF